MLDTIQPKAIYIYFVLKAIEKKILDYSLLLLKDF